MKQTVKKKALIFSVAFTICAILTSLIIGAVDFLDPGVEFILGKEFILGVSALNAFFIALTHKN